jgi:hypothetical protein
MACIIGAQGGVALYGWLFKLRLHASDIRTEALFAGKTGAVR